MKKVKHKWWHFIYGREAEEETIINDGRVHIANYWDTCKKCGKQLTEKQGMTTLSFKIEMKAKPK